MQAEVCVCLCKAGVQRCANSRVGVPRRRERERVMESARSAFVAEVSRSEGQMVPPANAVESYKASMNGDGLRILDHLPQIIERGAEALTPAEKELLKWVGVFFRRPTPGKFMMRIRMPNGFAKS